MSIFITADTHFSHAGIIFHAKRPFIGSDGVVDTLAMDKTLINNWNDMVNKGDTVYILGDFAWRNHNRYIAALKGDKILIRGNHDKMNRDCLRNFTEVHDALFRTFRWERDGRHFCQQIYMSHYAHRTWPSSCHGSWNLYGHSHGTMPEYPDMLAFDVGVDVWGYRPVPLEVIERKMATKTRRQYDNESDGHVSCDEMCAKIREENMRYL